MAHNVTHEVIGRRLVLTIDLGPQSFRNAPASKTGKSRLLATTGGFADADANGRKVSYSVNVSFKPDTGGL